MDELLETLDFRGKPLGLAPRSRIHGEGLWHRAANVLLFDPDGRLWIQRRAAAKDVWPGGWDLSVAEHLAPGESYREAAARGLSEELAVADVILEPLGGIVRSRLDLPEAGIRDYEYQQSFRAVHDGPPEPNPAEVAEVRLLALEALDAAFVEHPDDFTPWFRQRMSELRPLLRSRR
jgi:isopentenyldiphosphate isomerase